MARLALIPVVIVGATLIALLVRSVRCSAVIWSYDGPANNIAVPTISGNLVVAAFSEGQVTCLRVIDGSEVWPVPFRRPQRFITAPGVAAGAAIVCSDYGKVCAVDITDGQKRWEADLQDLLSGAPLVTDEAVYVVSSSGKVHAFSAKTGNHRWATSTGTSLCGQPTFCEGVIVTAGSEGIILGLDADSGRILWRRPLSATLNCPVAEVAGLAAVGSDQGHMYVLDPATGKVMFSAGTAGLIRTKAASDGRNLYFCDTDGWLRKLELPSGIPQFSRRLGKSVEAGPVLYRDAIYCLVDGERVVEVNPADGDVRRCWRGYGAACRLAVDSYYLVVGTYTGKLFAIELES